MEVLRLSPERTDHALPTSLPSRSPASSTPESYFAADMPLLTDSGRFDLRLETFVSIPSDLPTTLGVCRLRAPPVNPPRPPYWLQSHCPFVHAGSRVAADAALRRVASDPTDLCDALERIDVGREADDLRLGGESGRTDGSA